MELSRRSFLKATTAGGAAALAFDLSKAKAEMRAFKISRTTETRSTCPYCSVSCGVIIHTLGDRAKNATSAIVGRRRRFAVAVGICVSLHRSWSATSGGRSGAPMRASPCSVSSGA